MAKISHEKSEEVRHIYYIHNIIITSSTSENIVKFRISELSHTYLNSNGHNQNCDFEIYFFQNAVLQFKMTSALLAYS